jgi:hypothetical protein
MAPGEKDREQGLGIRKQIPGLRLIFCVVRKTGNRD